MGDFRIHVGAYPEPPPRRRRCGCRHRLAEAKVRGRGGQRPDAILLRPRDVLSVPRPGGGRGIDADRIAPGILPVQNWTKVQQFAAGCGAAMPPQIAQGFENAARQRNERLYALAQATQLADRLVEGGCAASAFLHAQQRRVDPRCVPRAGDARASLSGGRSLRAPTERRQEPAHGCRRNPIIGPMRGRGARARRAAGALPGVRPGASDNSARARQGHHRTPHAERRAAPNPSQVQDVPASAAECR